MTIDLVAVSNMPELGHGLVGIDQIDSRLPRVDTTELFAFLLQRGSFWANSVEAMISICWARASSTKIRKLTICAHGFSDGSGFKFGRDTITVEHADRDVFPLIRLGPLFDKNGLIILSVCDAGKRTEIMTAIARTAGVPVYAYSEAMNPNLSTGLNLFLNGGTMRVARPNGSLATTAVYPK
jgi:hypothetical protein